MADSQQIDLAPTPEQRRIATQLFERARQAMQTGNYDYAIELLQTCCKLDPANLIYRRSLRRTEKTKYDNNLRGSWWAWVTTARAMARLGWARRAGDDRKVLEFGEAVLSRNPWHTRVQLVMAEAAERLGMPEVAIFILEQARQKNPQDPRVNRPLARLYERQGNFAQAIALWDLVVKALPQDEEASRKRKDLAATDTIVKGHYVAAALGVEEAAPYRETDASLASATTADNPLARQVEPLRARIAADPANPNPYLRLAEVYQTAQRLDEAAAVLREGLEATGRHFDLQIALAELEIEPFRTNLRITEERLKAEPGDEELARLRVRLLKEINARELEIYRQRADRYPSDLPARLELGIRLLRAGQMDEAIQELQQARKDPRHRWRALLYLGHAFKAKNNRALAKRNFAEALEALPPEEEESRKELLYQLAKSAAEENDWGAALHLGNELANLDFGYRDIGRLLDEWLERAQPPSTPG
jgi:predicted Zn-dependent protease